MKSIFYKGFALLLLCVSVLKVNAQENPGNYALVAKGRADKIVAQLDIKNKKKAAKASKIIADQYENLAQLHGQRDSAIKAAGNDTTKTRILKTNAERQIKALHTKFLSNLSTDLTPGQIEGVKDGMTYNTVPLTYANYLLMLPYLTAEQQSRIKAYLVEAREHAMDGGTAKEKQGWFGKYKGRIANYLSSEEYVLKTEGEEWAKRRETSSKEIAIQRSGDIVKSLMLDTINKSRNESVRNLIALHYQTVERYTQQWNIKVNKLKDSTGLNADVRTKLEHESWLLMREELQKKRDLFLKKLLVYLDKSQVEAVKAGMTNDGLSKEYNHYQSLLPGLKEDEKKAVLAYLTEARDNAMNVLTDREIKQWFAKFRGRANNYLAAKGYNLRKATEEWEKKSGMKSPY
jgi:hypothetical protein